MLTFFCPEFAPSHLMWFVGFALQNIADRHMAQPHRLSVEIFTLTSLFPFESMW